MQHSSGASTARRQLYREPRVTVIERPGSERRGCEADQLDSLLTEFLSLRSAQAYMLEQPSVLMASCSLLPPCCNAIAPNFSSCCSASFSQVHIFDLQPFVKLHLSGNLRHASCRYGHRVLLTLIML